MNSFKFRLEEKVWGYMVQSDRTVRAVQGVVLDISGTDRYYVDFFPTPHRTWLHERFLTREKISEQDLKRIKPVLPLYADVEDFVDVSRLGYTTSQEEWESRLLGLAMTVSEWSRDPSTKCGSVIADENNRVIGLGYNGFPRGVIDLPERYEDRDEKYPRVVHAEVNAILNAVNSVEGATLYIYPIFTCSECAKVIIQSGIKKVVSLPLEGELKDRWGSSTDLAMDMYSEAGVETCWKNLE